MPLYRRGPGFLAARLDAPLKQTYGPPDDSAARALALEIDLRVFSIYFLVAESLATFVAYRIAQHCLRGCRLRFLSPSARMWIGVLYCSLKMSLINYAFRGSAYFTCSLLITLWYAVYAVMALGFHFGPLQFLFFDCIPRSKMTRSLYHRLAFVCKEVSSRLEFYALQRWLALPPVLDDGRVTAPADSEESPTSIASPPPPGFSRVHSFFGRQVDVNISHWNMSVCAQWALALATAGRGAATCPEHLVDVFEARFLFMMQRDGLLLGFFLMSPTATLMMKFHATGSAVPFELLLRYHCRERSALAATTPLFLYAESGVLFGRATPAQRTYIYELLRALNATVGRVVDVPLRALRSKNFIDAGVGRVVKKKARRPGFLGEMDGSFL